MKTLFIMLLWILITVISIVLFTIGLMIMRLSPCMGIAAICYSVLSFGLAQAVGTHLKNK